MNKIGLVLCMLAAGMVALPGLFFVLKGARRIQQSMASTRWPTVTGKVVSAETTRDVTGSRRGTSVTYNTETVIGYTVNGRDYTTDQLYFGQTLGSSDRSEAEIKLLRYPVGREVPVSYDPSNPAVGVMKAGLNSDAFWLPGAGLAFLLPAALLFYLLPSMFRDTTADQQAFAEYVQSAMANRQAGLRPPPRSDDKVMPIAAAFFGAVFCCLGVLALTSGLERAWQASDSRSWPTVSGVITRTGGDEPDDSTDSAYRARIVYKYDVKGATHFNNRRSFAQVEDRARYKTGDRVKVSYLPRDPDTAVIESGNSSEALWMPGIGIVLLLFSFAVFYWVVPAVSRPIGM